MRVIEGRERLQPNPNGPLPAPESYDRDSCGPKPERPGEVAIGTVIEPVPVTGLAANFSPMLRMAPPPLGNVTLGTSMAMPFFFLLSGAALLAEAFTEGVGVIQRRDIRKFVAIVSILFIDIGHIWVMMFLPLICDFWVHYHVHVHLI